MPEPAPLILLLDDDEDFLEINRQILEPAGYRIMFASSPAEAWQRLQEEKPALIVSDLMMTNLDSGFSFSRQVREDPRFAEIPIIIATAVTSQTGMSFRPRSPQDLAAMCVDAYFDKPIPPRPLIEKVKELLARKA